MSARSLIVLAYLALHAMVAAAAPEDLLLNDSWDYIENPTLNPAEVQLHRGTAVDLPHTWNSHDPVDENPGYRRDAGWYRKTLSLPGTDSDSRYLLYFEGANMKADVYVNGKRAGGHVGGYLGFTIDITELARPGADNEILVRVDNGVDRDLIPSQKADFVLYGGLTRDVHLRVRPGTYISRLQVDPSVAAGSPGRVEVMAMLDGNLDVSAGTSVQFRVLGPDGSEVASGSAMPEKSESSTSATTQLPGIPDPLLWSPDSPHLYRLEATLVDENGDHHAKIVRRVWLPMV